VLVLKSIKIAIVYHSETGNTKRMAELVKKGCDSINGVESKIISIDEVLLIVKENMRFTLIA
jgi:NAD(P)H dehydrogenase (quinone)